MFLFSSTASALDVKLQCDIKVKYTYFNGDSENNQSTAIIEVGDYGVDKKYIFITSADEIANNLSVTTTQELGKAYTNYSDENKWDIQNTYSGNEGRVVNPNSTRIVIDRNSGELIVSSSFTVKSNGRTNTTGISGNCRKINTSVKKF
jgi:hypothetical protein